MQPEPSDTDEPFPMQCRTLQCLFWLGDERLQLRDGNRTFKQQYTLGRPVKKHLDALDATGKTICPHPRCKATGTTVSNAEHLKNHAHKEHGIRLQTR